MPRTFRPHTRIAGFMVAASIIGGALTLGAQPAAPDPVRADSGVQVRVGGDVAVAADAREALVLVVRGSADVAGTVAALIVIDGDARISGGRVHDLTVVRGRADLRDGAQVTGDVHLFDAEIATDSGSRVLGQVERGMSTGVAQDLLRIVTLLGLGLLMAVVLAGVLGATLAPIQVRATGQLMTAETGRVLLGSVIVWFALPIVAGALIPTIIGLPIGIGYFLFVLPALAFLGFLVSGTWLGDVLLRRLRAAVTPPHPAAAAALGITSLVLIGRIPFLGLISAIAMFLGTGAVMLAAWRAIMGVSKPGV